MRMRVKAMVVASAFWVLSAWTWRRRRQVPRDARGHAEKLVGLYVPMQEALAGDGSRR